MPLNLLDNPLLPSVAIRIGIVLGAGLIAVALKERKPWSELRQTTLFLRVRSWAVIAPIFVLALFSGGVVVFLLAALIGLQGSREYSRLVGLGTRYRSLLYIWVIAGLLIAALARRYLLFLPIGFFVLLTLVPIVSGEVQGAHRQVAGTMFGYLYIGLPMAYLVFIKAAEDWGLEFLLLVGMAVALSDVGAFVAGSVLKGPRLAPSVSPGKRWSGLVGNLAGAAGGFWLLSFVIPTQWTPWGLTVLVIAISVGAVWGDLTESFVKRDFAVKDAGDFIPGFGGILDRVDSFLLALPLSYYALLIANHLSRTTV